jgi:PII-like signaling protein
VTVPGLKLTVYCGERDRAPGGEGAAGPLAEALMALFARHRIRTSCLLRGVEGFGARHRLQTTRMLTLSEDLPLVAVAVDAPAAIEGLLDEVAALQRRGLATLERVALLDGGDPLPGGPGDALRVTLHLGRQQRIGGRPAHLVAVETLRAAGVDGATVLLGVDGTTRGVRARARFLSRNADVPLLVISAGGRAASAAALERLHEQMPGLLATVERVHVAGGASGSRGAAPAPGAHRKLTVYGSEQTLVEGQPLHAALVRRLRAEGMAGATALRGLWGYHGDRAPHGDRFLALRRHVPVVTVAIDLAPRIERATAIAGELTARGGLVTIETVPALRAGGLEGLSGSLRLGDAG